MNRLSTPIHAHPFTCSSYEPMDTLAIDYIERLRPDDTGNDFIIVIIDTFTRFIELYPSKGAFRKITSDNGSSFVNDTIKELLKLVGTEHHLTMAYSKEENAIVERANREVMRHLRNIIFDRGVIVKWSLYLPLVQRILNSSIHKTTGVSPASLLFGNTLQLDKGILFPQELSQEDQKTKLSAWIADMLVAQEQVINVARSNLKEKDEIHLKNYTTLRTEYPINS